MNLVDAVATAPRRRLTGHWWHQGPTHHPLTSFADPARGPGRYHRQGEPGVWYASNQEQAAWAELFRHFVDDGIDPFELRRRVGRCGRRPRRARPHQPGSPRASRHRRGRFAGRRLRDHPGSGCRRARSGLRRHSRSRRRPAGSPDVSRVRQRSSQRARRAIRDPTATTAPGRPPPTHPSPRTSTRRHPSCLPNHRRFRGRGHSTTPAAIMSAFQPPAERDRLDRAPQCRTRVRQHRRFLRLNGPRNRCVALMAATTLGSMPDIQAGRGPKVTRAAGTPAWSAPSWRYRADGSSEGCGFQRRATIKGVTTSESGASPKAHESPRTWITPPNTSRGREPHTTASQSSDTLIAAPTNTMTNPPKNSASAPKSRRSASP